MTLILTAICKDDISVCSDTRYIDNKWSGGFKDGFDKIHKFSSHPLIIFNHGVNKFGEKYWNDYCLEYEKSERWKNKNLKSISEDFKSFIESIVLKQLELNIKSNPNDNNVKNSGFVLCGKNFQSNNFEIYEYFWTPQPKFGYWNKVCLNGSGTGYDIYLKGDINDTRSDKFVNWNAFNQGQIKNELERLFFIARERKNNAGGKEFSDDFTIKSLTE
jgi:hypothetical protein